MRLAIYFLPWLLIAAPGVDAQTVYITETGTKYHQEDCRYLQYSKKEIDREDAADRNYLPCKVCQPDTAGEKGQETRPVTASSVYVTATGEKYHAQGCRYLKHSKRKMDRANAVNSGYDPCKVCRPDG